ncbi:hypothetical protein BH24PSE2_BH24PSE2_23610 [soil metagenome]
MTDAVRTMNCLEFRRRCGADPGCDAPEFEEHLGNCRGCAAFAAELRALDGLILEALRIEARDDARKAVAHAPPAARPRQWAALSMAASVVLAIALAAGLWLSAPRTTLAGEVVAHVLHEPQAFATPALHVSEQEVAAVLGITEAALDAKVWRATYATICPFRGQTIPHLVLDTDQGQVTVLVLRDEPVADAVPIDGPGLQGMIVPLGKGSVAILGREPIDLDAIQSQIFAALR